MDDAAMVSAIASGAATGVYVYLAWRLSRRKVSSAARLPAAQFSLFWLGLAIGSAITAVESAVAIAVLPSLAFVLTLFDLNILVSVAALWGLVGYLLYLFLGRHLLVPLSLLYGSLYVLLLYYITASDPVAVSLTMGTVGLTFGSQLQGPILAVLVLLLIGPEFLGAILYFTLYFRTRDPTVRYRIALVSWSLIGWFGLSLVPIASALGGGLAAQVVARSLGIIAALVILAAYYPPRAIRSAFGVVGVDENPPGPVPSSA